MSGVVPFSGFVENLPWSAHSALGASSTAATATAIAAVPATDVHPARRVSRVRAATTQAPLHTAPRFEVDGKVDVFLDLACTDSATAWTTIKQVLWEYGFRTEFVFHVLPTSQSQVLFDASKAMQVFRMHSADSDECALFIDAMLDHQNLITNEADDDVARLEFFEEVLVKGAVAQGSITEDQFRRGMEDPQVVDLVRSELDSAASLGVQSTPTVLLNDIYMMRLVGADQLRNFELFVGRGMSPQPLYQVDGESVWPSVEDGSGP